MITLNISQFVKRSQANGPGYRAVVWVQGCGFKCPGCFNPETHRFGTGQDIGIKFLARQIVTLYRQGRIEGVTVSGGEPLQQLHPLTEFFRLLRAWEPELSIICFTGYSPAEIEKFSNRDFLEYIDVLLAGRYDQGQHTARALVGSANKKSVFLTDHYTQSDLDAVPESEVIIQDDGSIVLTGIRPPTLASLGFE